MKKKQITQKDIAEKLGLDRTTVNKILNGGQSEIIRKETIDKVMETAHKMGYDFSKLRRYYKRDNARKPVNIDLDIVIRYLDGTVYDSGTAKALNMSYTGILMTNFKMEKMSVPLEPFEMVISFDNEDLSEVKLKSEVIRLHSNGTIDVGAKFMNITEGAKRSLINFLNDGV